MRFASTNELGPEKKVKNGRKNNTSLGRSEIYVKGKITKRETPIDKKKETKK